MNADDHVDSTGGVLNSNLFAYCGNDPVNRVDPEGKFWIKIWDFLKVAFSETGQALESLVPAYAGCGIATLVDGHFPLGIL